jgi:hypothetical protein
MRRGGPSALCGVAELVLRRRYTFRTIVVQLRPGYPVCRQCKLTGGNIKGSNGANLLSAEITDSSYGIRLGQTSLQPVVLHGDAGLIPYGPVGSSFYYSWTKLWTFGTVFDHGVPVEVIGESWMDHQWYNPLSVFGGWTWFSIQLTNDTQYMLYFIRDSQNQLARVVATEVKNGMATHLSPPRYPRRRPGPGRARSPVSLILRAGKSPCRAGS